MLAGQRIAHYQLHELIGAGGMGEVYRATDTKLGRDVAVKVLHASFANDPSRRSRFKQEARALAALNHPHIAAVYGFEEARDGCALVLEFIEGPTLADRLHRSPMPVKEALRIAYQIADALEAAHEKDIIHRDLKPANIKITPGGKVKVLDFGLAKALVDDAERVGMSDVPTGTRQGVILGTAAYMSPEQATGQSVDKRTDIWAFGCVLYEMFSGRCSFACDSVPETIAAVLGQDPDWKALPAATPENILRLLRRCLEKDAKRRLHHIADARIEIDELLSGPEGRTAPNKKKRTLGLFAAVSVMVLLAAFGAYFLLNVGLRNIPKSNPAEPFAKVTERQITTNPIENPISFAAISPDGKYVAYSDATAIRLRLIDTGETRILSAPGGL
jgi:serine/threonine protein kinase